jgi:hypothetical protein
VGFFYGLNTTRLIYSIIYPNSFPEAVNPLTVICKFLLPQSFLNHSERQKYRSENVAFRIGPTILLRSVLCLLVALASTNGYAYTSVNHCLAMELSRLTHQPVEDLPPKFEHQKQATFPAIESRVDREVRWTTELPQIKSKNQCESACWANSAVTAEEYVLPGHDKLSANYMVAQILLSDFKAVLTGGSTRPMGVPNYAENALNFSRYFGALPEEIYPSDPNVDGKRVAAELNKLLEPILNLQSNDPANPQTLHLSLYPSMEESKDLYLQALKIVQANFGKFPQDFVYKGKRYQSASDFSAREVNQFISFKSEKFSEETFQQTLSSVQKSLSAKKPVLLDYRHFESLLDPKTGRYKLGRISEPGDNHSVLITGFATNWRGRVSYLKLKNSHGEPDTLIMPVDYLQKFGMGVVFVNP